MVKLVQIGVNGRTIRCRMHQTGVDDILQNEDVQKLIVLRYKLLVYVKVKTFKRGLYSIFLHKWELYLENNTFGH